jgi:hypothetical protein
VFFCRGYLGMNTAEWKVDNLCITSFHWGHSNQYNWATLFWIHIYIYIRIHYTYFIYSSCTKWMPSSGTRPMMVNRLINLHQWLGSWWLISHPLPRTNQARRITKSWTFSSMILGPSMAQLRYVEVALESKDELYYLRYEMRWYDYPVVNIYIYIYYNIQSLYSIYIDIHLKSDAELWR